MPVEDVSPAEDPYGGRMILGPEARAAAEQAARSSSAAAVSGGGSHGNPAERVTDIGPEETQEQARIRSQGEYGSFIVTGAPYRIEDGIDYDSGRRGGAREVDPESPSEQMAQEDRGGRVWRALSRVGRWLR